MDADADADEVSVTVGVDMLAPLSTMSQANRVICITWHARQVYATAINEERTHVIYLPLHEEDGPDGPDAARIRDAGGVLRAGPVHVGVQSQNFVTILKGQAVQTVRLVARRTDGELVGTGDRPWFLRIEQCEGGPDSSTWSYLPCHPRPLLIHRLPAWERNPAKRLVKAPKVFLPDSGLLAHLTGHTTDTLATAPGLPGDLVETFVCAELLKHLAFSARGLSLWHYRTQTGIEVDFLLEDRHAKLTGIEVKAAATVDGKDFKGLRHLQETEPERFQRGIVLYAGREYVAFGEALYAVPMSVWWATQAPAA